MGAGVASGRHDAGGKHEREHQPQGDEGHHAGDQVSDRALCHVQLSPWPLRKLTAPAPRYPRRELTKAPIDGVKVIMNEECITDVQADINGPGARTVVGAGLAQSDSPPPVLWTQRALRTKAASFG